MNEDEKEAIFEIEKLTAEIYTYMGIEKVRFYHDKYKTILNLIEKQQKEIEKLKIKCKELIKEKQQLTSAILDSIPNEKIKAKMEELEYEGTQEYWTEQIIQMLKALIGE